MKSIRSSLALLAAVLVLGCSRAAHQPEQIKIMPPRSSPAHAASAILLASDNALADRLAAHVQRVAARPHHAAEKVELEKVARYLEEQLIEQAYEPIAQTFSVGQTRVRNIEVLIPGSGPADEHVVIGAHYDSARGTPGANDNGSGVAALLEIARSLRGFQPGRTLHLVFFVNEEPPYFKSEHMGSVVYARRAKQRGENVVAMLSLETIAYFSDLPASQQFPSGLAEHYPSVGNFIGFIGNLQSAALMHSTLASFRRHSSFPAEGLSAPADVPGVSWSDHWSFWQEGYPALMVTDTAPFRYPHYHTEHDTPDKLDYARLALLTAGLLGVIVDLSRP